MHTGIHILHENWRDYLCLDRTLKISQSNFLESCHGCVSVYHLKFMNEYLANHKEGYLC